MARRTDGSGRRDAGLRRLKYLTRGTAALGVGLVGIFSATAAVDLGSSSGTKTATTAAGTTSSGSTSSASSSSSGDSSSSTLSTPSTTPSTSSGSGSATSGGT